MLRTGLISARGGVVVDTPFAPDDISGLMAWYKGDDLSGTDGDPIGTWADASGNGRDLTQATSSKKPTIQTVSGKRVLRFDGVDDEMLTAAFASPTSGVTVYAIASPTGTSFRHIAIHAATGSWASPYARWALRARSDSDDWEAWVQDGGDVPTNYVAGGSPTGGTWRVMSLHYDQSNVTLRQDGSALHTKGRSGALTSSTEPLIMGARTASGEFWSGDIRELIVYDNGVSAGDLADLDTYAAGEKP